MLVYKCKMCGGSLELGTEATVAVCEYCGSKQTLPKLDNEKKLNLYDRANHFRRDNDFDKAMGIYEQILNEDNTDAEAYWSLVLCRYGIEYVEDPATRKRVPTVNRSQYTSIYDDDNYKSALQYADAMQRVVYEAEAREINEIQKGILEISQKEEPFDVFICYKESDNSGRRTPDSVLATELYHELTNEGFKVFFSRITLEDKLGTAYEPYIFAALNSAKVMVVLGTKQEYFNAVWVKNEWSRYLALIKNGAKKMLIPAYRDMDPYNLPEEFSHLQAQDMSKLGFMQDLIRGIKKIVNTKPTVQSARETVVMNQSANLDALLKRASLALEDGEFDKAAAFSDQVLNLNAECADAYFVQLLADLKLRSKEQLETYGGEYLEHKAYKKTIRFANETQNHELLSFFQKVEDRKKIAKYEAKYQQGMQLMQIARDDSIFKRAAKIFEEIQGYKNADELALSCYEQAKTIKVEVQYQQAISFMQHAQTEKEFQRAAKNFEYIHGYKNADELKKTCYDSAKSAKISQTYNYALKLLSMRNVSEVVNAKKLFESIKDYRDSATKIEQCDKVIQQLEAKRIADQKRAEEERRAYEIAKRKKRKITIISSISAVAVCGVLIWCFVWLIPSKKYSKAMSLFNNHEYQDAYIQFDALRDFKDSFTMKQESQYLYAVSLFEQGEFKKARSEFTLLKGYRDSQPQIRNCDNASHYADAVALYNEGKYVEAISAFSVLGDYNDSKSQIELCLDSLYGDDYQSGLNLQKEKKYNEAIEAFEKIDSEYKDTQKRIEECKNSLQEEQYQSAVAFMENKEYEKAIAEFEMMKEYSESKAKLLECRYQQGLIEFNNGNYTRAKTLFDICGDYQDSKNYVVKCENKLHPPASVSGYLYEKSYPNKTKEGYPPSYSFWDWCLHLEGAYDYCDISYTVVDGYYPEDNCYNEKRNKRISQKGDITIEECFARTYYYPIDLVITPYYNDGTVGNALKIKGGEVASKIVYDYTEEVVPDV